MLFQRFPPCLLLIENSGNLLFCHRVPLVFLPFFLKCSIESSRFSSSLSVALKGFRKKGGQLHNKPLQLLFSVFLFLFFFLLLQHHYSDLGFGWLGMTAGCFVRTSQRPLRFRYPPFMLLTLSLSPRPPS